MRGEGPRFFKRKRPDGTVGGVYWTTLRGKRVSTGCNDLQAANAWRSQQELLHVNVPRTIERYTSRTWNLRGPGVYFVGNAANNLVKIGFSANSVAKRCTDLQRSSPVALWPLAIVATRSQYAQYWESVFHGWFLNRWAGGEFFEMTEADIRGIVAIGYGADGEKAAMTLTAMRVCRDSYETRLPHNDR